MTKKQLSRMFGTSRSNPTRDGAPEAVKAEVITKVNDLIETVLKPQHIQPPPDNPQFNYIVDLYGKWYQRYFYLCATYRVPDLDARLVNFEVKCAHMEYACDNHFYLSFPRHTGQWVELYTDIPLDECLVSIRNEPFFFP